MAIGKGGSHASPGYHILRWKQTSLSTHVARGRMVGQRKTLGNDRSCLTLTGCRTDSFLRAQPRGDIGERAAPGDNRAGRTAYRPSRAQCAPCARMRARLPPLTTFNYLKLHLTLVVPYIHVCGFMGLHGPRAHNINYIWREPGWRTARHVMCAPQMQMGWRRHAVLAPRKSRDCMVSPYGFGGQDMRGPHWR